MINYDLPLNVDLGDGFRTIRGLFPNVLALPGNKNAHTWIFRIKRNGVAEDLTGASILGKFENANGVTIPILGTIAGNTCSVTMDQSCYAVEGKLRCVFTLTTTTVGPVPLADITISVSEAISPDTSDPLDIIPDISELLAMVETLNGATEDAEAATQEALDAAEVAYSAKFRVMGLKATIDALRAERPLGEAGDAFAVGTAASNVIYIWDIDVGDWVSIGAIPVSFAETDPTVPSWAKQSVKPSYTAPEVGALGFKRAPYNTCILFGDSITIANGTDALTRDPSSALQTNGEGGYMTWANIMLCHRFKILTNKGVSGNTTGQMLSRLSADVLNFKPKADYVFVMGGTNDIAAEDTTATVANITSICDQILAAGMRLVLFTVLPSTLCSTTSKKAFLAAVNTAIRAYASAHYDTVILVDAYKSWNPDGSGRDEGTPPTDYTIDGTHPSRLGAKVLGEATYNATAGLVPPFDHYAGATQINPNPRMLGTGGSWGGSGGTGSVATGYRVNTGGAGFTGSKVARTDGLGYWQQVVNPTGGSAVTCSIEMNAAPIATTVGDLVFAMFDFEIDVASGDESYIENVSGRILIAGATNNKSTDLQYSGTASPHKAYIRKGTMVTPVITIGASATGINPQFFFLAKGTVRVGNIRVFKL
jgi:lysophospholipase L1-like esterase